MTISLLTLIVLSLTAWTAFMSRQWRHRDDSSLGLMSQYWISEQRADESRHRAA